MNGFWANPFSKILVPNLVHCFATRRWRNTGSIKKDRLALFDLVAKRFVARIDSYALITVGPEVIRLDVGRVENQKALVGGGRDTLAGLDAMHVVNLVERILVGRLLKDEVVRGSIRREERGHGQKHSDALYEPADHLMIPFRTK
jgi:hypothetical protein